MEKQVLLTNSPPMSLGQTLLGLVLNLGVTLGIAWGLSWFLGEFGIQVSAWLCFIGILLYRTIR